MSIGNGAATPVRLMSRLEAARGLDRAVEFVEPWARSLIGSPARRHLLHGHWLGHAVHPLMTDAPLGMWTSAHLLDLAGGPRARPAAELLLGAGLVAAVPTAVTGLAEWAPLGEKDKRTGIVHAAANSTALLCYGSSLLLRRRGRHRAGVAVALLGGLAAGAGGYLGGHLIEVRKVSSRHPGFTEPAMPQETRSDGPTDDPPDPQGDAAIGP